LLEARYFLGCDLQDRGKPQDLKEAEDTFMELRRWAPDYVQVHARLGRLYQAEGRLPEAEQEYQRQLGLDPWDLDTVHALAGMDAGAGKLDAAEAVLAAAQQRWPQDPDIARNLAAVRAGRQRSARPQAGRP
ncbi:MAG TPA: tetratricopeptide repeat protein, partial [bacterium]|nr:tetratricopeptide repeat protein [bacterium]